MASRDSQKCPHCARPVPTGAPTRPYCCRGCRGAHALLGDLGLTRFYDLRRGAGLPVGDPEEDQALTWLEPLLEAAPPNADGRRTLTIDVQGIHCAGCVWLLETLFSRREGAVHLEVNPGLGRLAMTFDADFDVAAYLREVRRFGYQSGPPIREAGRTRSDDLLMRLGVSSALALNSMMLSLAVYLGLAPGESLHELFSWVNLALATIAVLVGGPVFFRGALQGLRRRTLHLDVPIALGIALAWGGSLALFVAGDDDAAYFDTLTIFIALMLAGRFVQERLLQRNRRLLLDDPGLGGLHVRRVGPDERLQVVPVGRIAAGDRLLLAPGELVPVDAALAEDDASFSLAWINGESEPSGFTAGAVVPAGAHLVGGEARRLVAATGFASSGLHDLLARGARGQGTPAVRFWDVVTRHYVVAVLGFAALGILLWAPTDLVTAVQVAVAVLVVTCPCALGLATPLAYELGHADLRRRGLFVRRADFFDRALGVRKVFLDKTGTLTLGTLEVAEPALVRGLDRAARAALFQMTARSNHPKSRAIFSLLADEGHPLAADARVEEVAGTGLRFTDEAGLRWTLTRGGDEDPRLALARQGEVLLRLAFEEALRHDARREVAALEARGLDVWLLSGDEPGKVAAAAELLGVAAERALGGLSPKHKAEIVRAADHRDTLMLGDGINDALALEAAFCAGTPAVDRPTLPARADFYLIAGGGVGPIARALTVASRVRAVTRRNLGFAILYNAIGIGLALAGVVTPLICAIAMPMSSIVVLGSTAWTLGRDGANKGARVPQLAEVTR